MSHKIRLGPIAVFLTVVAVVITTLAMLTVSTSNADLVLARRFADVTQLRYELEAEGERFIREYDEQAAAGAVDAAGLGLTEEEGVYVKTIEKGGYSLEIRLTEPDGAGSYELTGWKLIKDWNADDPLDDIWKGE